MRASGDVVIRPGVTAGTVRVSTVCLGLPTTPIASRHKLVEIPPTWCPPGVFGAELVGPAARVAYVCGGCSCNMLNALCMRHGVEPPPVTLPGPYHFEEVIDMILEAKPWLNPRYSLYDHSWWLLRWCAGKRQAIITSMKRDLLKPSAINCMVKREVHHDVPTKARAIQFYRSLADQAAFGPAFVLLQKSIFAYLNTTMLPGGVRVTCASGLPPTEIASWMTRVFDRFPRPWFYERDGKNWDATMQEFHHDQKMKIYRAYSEPFARFVQAGFKARGEHRYPSGRLVYVLNGTVKSGHNDTTLGNSLINALITYEACRRLGLRAEILVAGDDCLVATDGDPSGMVEVERGLGIKPEARVFRNYLDVTFISACWLPGEGGYLFVPKLGRLLARLNWTTSPPSARKYVEYRDGVRAGLMKSCRQVPLYHEFIREPTGKPGSLGKGWDYWLGSFGGVGPNRWTREALKAKYHLLETEYAELKRFLSDLPDGPALFNHPLTERVVEFDLCGIAERRLALGSLSHA